METIFGFWVCECLILDTLHIMYIYLLVEKMNTSICCIWIENEFSLRTNRYSFVWIQFGIPRNKYIVPYAFIPFHRDLCALQNEQISATLRVSSSLPLTKNIPLCATTKHKCGLFCTLHSYQLYVLQLYYLILINVVSIHHTFLIYCLLRCVTSIPLTRFAFPLYQMPHTIPFHVHVTDAFLMWL